ENGTAGDFAGCLSFWTRANGGSTTERARISSAGNLLIGSTTDNGTDKLQVTGSAIVTAATNVTKSVVTTDATQTLTNKTINAANNTITLPNVGPGAGTYTVGAKLTGGGVNGTITLDAQGRITAITQAT